MAFSRNRLRQIRCSNHHAQRALQNRLLSKPSNSEEFSGAYGAQNRSVLDVREAPSTGSTTKIPKRGSFRKKSNEFLREKSHYEAVSIILHRPQLAENTGMAMRAIANTGIKNLRLISPMHEWPSEKAELASAEKAHLLNIEVFDSLQEAISDLQLVFATSARRRNMIKEIYTPESAAQKISSFSCSDIKCGVVFGNEKFGLTNEEISICNLVIEIPSINFSSYNLAQSVLIICYQIMIASFESKHENTLRMGKTSIAEQSHMDYFLNILERELESRRHFSSEEKHVLMMQTIRNLFKRCLLTSQEIQSMLGVVDTLKK
jgi:tRNA/rRNA methyltransferase